MHYTKSAAKLQKKIELSKHFGKKNAKKVSHAKITLSHPDSFSEFSQVEFPENFTFHMFRIRSNLTDKNVIPL
jgi:hypothetical protein